MLRERLPLVVSSLATFALGAAAISQHQLEKDYYLPCSLEAQGDLEEARQTGLRLFDHAVNATEASCRENKPGLNCRGFPMDPSFRRRAKESLRTLEIFCSQKYGENKDASTIKGAVFDLNGDLIGPAQVVMHQQAFTAGSNPYTFLRCELVDSLVHETAHTVTFGIIESEDHKKQTDWIYRLGNEAGRHCDRP